MSNLKFPLSRFTNFIVAIVFVIYALIQAKELLYPILFGSMLSYLLLPVTAFLEKHHVPRVFAILLSILFMVFLVVVVLMFLYNQVELLVGDFPVLKKQALLNIRKLQEGLKPLFSFLNLDLNMILKPRLNVFFESGNTMVNFIFSATTGTIIKLGFMPVYIFLFLYYRTKIAHFILKLVPEEKEIQVIRILRDVSLVASRYMGGMTIVVLVMFLLNSTGLLLIGVKHPFTLGLIAAFFSFIPNFGTLIGGLFPLVFTLATGDLPNDPIKVVFMVLIINFIENNILTPNIVGNSINLSPMFIIFGLVAGATVWGIPGMLVVVPILSVFRIICQNIDRLQPYAFLLGTTGTKRYAVTIDNIRKWTTRKKRKQG